MAINHYTIYVSEETFSELAEVTQLAKFDKYVKANKYTRLDFLGSMLQSNREAYGNDNDDINGFLSGNIEADETYLGGKASNKFESKKLNARRGAVDKIGVLGMLQRDGNFNVKVLNKTKININININIIQRILNATIQSGSTLCADEHRSYIGNQFNHKVVKHSAKQFVDGGWLTQTVLNQYRPC